MLLVIYVDYLAADGVGFHPWYTFFGKNPLLRFRGKHKKQFLPSKFHDYIDLWNVPFGRTLRTSVTLCWRRLGGVESLCNGEKVN